jgi:hypothetical protein
MLTYLSILFETYAPKTTPLQIASMKHLQNYCRICHSRPPWFGATLESQAEEFSAKLGAVSIVRRLMKECSFGSNIVRMSTQQRMMEWGGLNS